MTKCHEGSAAKRRLSIRNGIHKRARPCLGSVILYQKLALKAQALETPLIGGGI